MKTLAAIVAFNSNADNPRKGVVMNQEKLEVEVENEEPTEVEIEEAPLAEELPEEEIQSYSLKVQKRINELTAQKLS